MARNTAPEDGNYPQRSRRAFLQTVVVAGVTSCAYWLAACGGSGQRATGPIIEMTDKSQFAPARIVMKTGETVTWRNTGRGLVHGVTTDPRRVQDATQVQSPAGVAPFDSGTIAGGAS